ncbi:MAG: type II toxin-antitoxin system VapC family toxin [Planctomycetes bacterium]|nr:type II toxin-antitoxin system VapC family toxin [Planctomycetota bacterium]
MRFWDSSAIVPLFVGQPSTRRVRRLYGDDPEAIAWVLSGVEFTSALCRLIREGALRREVAEAALVEFDAFWTKTRQVVQVEAVAQRARRLLRLHPLRAADALQLAAAITVSYEDSLSVELVCLDTRLAEIARLEGFRVVP